MIRDRRRDHRPIEYVPTVHYRVALAGEGGLQGSRLVGEEVVPATPPGDARARREVEPQVRVRQQQDPDVCRHPVMLRLSVFLR